jgi:hypothetical protein
MNGAARLIRRALAPQEAARGTAAWACRASRLKPAVCKESWYRHYQQYMAAYDSVQTICSLLFRDGNAAVVTSMSE